MNNYTVKIYTNEIEFFTYVIEAFSESEAIRKAVAQYCKYNEAEIIKVRIKY